MHPDIPQSNISISIVIDILTLNRQKERQDKLIGTFSKYLINIQEYTKVSQPIKCAFIT